MTDNVFLQAMARKMYERRRERAGASALALVCGETDGATMPAAMPEWGALDPAERGEWVDLASLAAAFVGDVATEAVDLAAALIDERSVLRVERGLWQGLEAEGELYCARVSFRQGYGKTAGAALYELRAALLSAAGETVREGRRAAEVIRGVMAGRMALVGKGANDGLPVGSRGWRRVARVARALRARPRRGVRGAGLGARQGSEGARCRGVGGGASAPPGVGRRPVRDGVRGER